jgi:hypothetical protein
MHKIAILSAILLLIALGIACGPTGSAGSTTDTPTEAYKRLFAAVKNKDTDAIKNEMSKRTVAFAESNAIREKKPPAEMYSNGLSSTTFSETLPEIRDERVKDNMGAVEVYNSKEKKWDDIPFILEDGKWKLAFGDAWANTYKSPGKGRDQKEREAANALGSNQIIRSPAANTNTMGMTTNTQPNTTASPKANTK